MLLHQLEECFHLPCKKFVLVVYNLPPDMQIKITDRYGGQDPLCNLILYSKLRNKRQKFIFQQKLNDEVGTAGFHPWMDFLTICSKILIQNKTVTCIFFGKYKRFTDNFI